MVLFIIILVACLLSLLFLLGTQFFRDGCLPSERQGSDALVEPEDHPESEKINLRLLGTQINSVLKDAGFRRKASTWNRTRGEFVDVVNLQRSQWRSAVTLNVSVVVPWIDQVKNEGKNKSFFNAWDGLAVERAGYLFSNRDMWWSMESEQVADELLAVIKDYVFP